MSCIYILEGWIDRQLDETVGAFASVFAAIYYLDHLRSNNGCKRVEWRTNGLAMSDILSGDGGRWLLREIEYNPKVSQ